MKGMSCPTFIAAILLLRSTLAIPWLEPDPTPTGLMAQVGISLLPTLAPGFNGIPKELLKRQVQTAVPFPPPLNWCGFVNGLPTDVLSCVATETCVYSGAVMGCCDAGAISTCTNIFTTCANAQDIGGACDAACQANYNILKCSYSDEPYCGTYNFDSGTRLYNCQSFIDQVYTVEFLANYYISALGVTLDSGPVTITDVSQTLFSDQGAAATTTIVVSVTQSPASGSPQSTGRGITGSVPSQSPSPSATSTTSNSGLSLGAIIGIAVGGGLGLLLVLAALVTFCCIRRRKARTPGHVLPVEHHFPSIEKPQYGGQYQPVAQQDRGINAHQVSAEGKAFDAPNSPPPPSFASVEQKPLGRELVPDTTRFSGGTISSLSTQQPIMQHASVSEMGGDIYRGAPTYPVAEVESFNPPLNGNGQRTYELDPSQYRGQADHNGIYEMGVPGVSMGPQFSGPYEMEHDRYAQ